MKVLVPNWPRSVPRNFRPVGPLSQRRPPTAVALAEAGARRLRERQDALRCSNYTGTWGEVLFVNRADYTAFNTSASEGSLLAGTSVNQPVLQPFFFDAGNRGLGRAVRLLARGVLGTTGTPTVTWQVRLSTTQGSSTLSGASVGVSAAVTTASGVTNVWWELGLDLVCTVSGQGASATTLAGSGYVKSPAGFAAPYEYALEPTTPNTATWTAANFDSTQAYYLNLSVTFSASSASNTVTCKQLMLFGLN